MNHRQEPGKLISVAAVILFTVLLLAASLGAATDPKAILDEASKKNAELTDTDTFMHMDIVMGIPDSEAVSEMAVQMDMDMKLTGMNTPQMVYLADTTMTMELAGMNQSMNTRTFYTDGYCYMDMLEQKFKYAMDLDSMVASLQNNTALTELSSDFMKDLSARKDGGNTIITFTGDPEKMNTYIQEVFAFMGQQMPTEGMDMNISEFGGSYTVNKDGYYIAEDITMIFSMALTEDLSSVISVNAIIHADFNNPGQPVEIVLPDTGEYMEIAMP